MLLAKGRATWDAWQRFALSRSGAGIMFGWAFAEAIAWPIIPEFLLVPLAAGAAAPRRIWRLLLSSILGSAAGGALLYLYAMKQPDEAQAVLARLPLVTDRQIERASVSLREHGVGALLVQPWTGVPLKVWAITAAAQGLDPRLAIPTFAISRALRIAALGLLAALLGDRARPFLREHWSFLTVAYMVVFFFGERRIVR